MADDPTTPAAVPAKAAPTTESRLAALEAAVASLGEVQIVHPNDNLESFRQWYEDYQAEHAEPPVPTGQSTGAEPSGPPGVLGSAATEPAAEGAK